MPDGKISTTFLGRGDQILSFLQVGRHVNPSRFSTVYDIDRILLSADAAMGGRTPKSVLAELLEQIPVPVRGKT